MGAGVQIPQTTPQVVASPRGAISIPAPRDASGMKLQLCTVVTCLEITLLLTGCLPFPISLPPSLLAFPGIPSQKSCT